MTFPPMELERAKHLLEIGLRLLGDAGQRRALERITANPDMCLLTGGIWEARNGENLRRFPIRECDAL